MWFTIYRCHQWRPGDGCVWRWRLKKCKKRQKIDDKNCTALPKILTKWLNANPLGVFVIGLRSVYLHYQIRLHVSQVKSGCVTAFRMSLFSLPYYNIYVQKYVIFIFMCCIKCNKTTFLQCWVFDHQKFLSVRFKKACLLRRLMMSRAVLLSGEYHKNNFAVWPWILCIKSDLYTMRKRSQIRKINEALNLEIFWGNSIYWFFGEFVVLLNTVKIDMPNMKWEQGFLENWGKIAKIWGN